MAETRLDRIERNLELLIHGISELKNSQQKTDEQLRRTDEQIKLSQQKTDEEIRELKLSQHQTDEQIRELKLSQQKTDEQLRRTDEQLKVSQQQTDAQFRRTDAKLERIGKQLADMGLVQGEIAEELFYRNIKYLFGKKKITLNEVYRNLKKKGYGEYDIVGINSDNVIVIEVKNKLAKRMVDDFLDKGIPRFKKLFPQFEKYSLIGGVGALVIESDVGKYAEKNGLYVLTQREDGGASIINKSNFKPKIFV